MRRSILLALVCFAALLSCAKKQSMAPPSHERFAQVITHRVESGDTWASLARDYYGDAERAEELARANGGDPAEELVPGSAIRVGLTGREVGAVKSRLEAARSYNAGLDLAAAGSYAEAATEFESAVRLNPRFPDASFNLAVAYQKLGFHKRAIDILGELTSQYPDNAEYHYALGVSRFAGGDLAGSRKAFVAALAKDPAHRKALFSLGVVCEKMGKSDEARSRFEQYLKLDSDGEWAEAARSHLDSLRRAGR